MSRSDGTAIQWVSGAAVARERVPGGIRPEAWPRAASIRWRSRIALVSGPDPAGHRRDRGRDPGRGREVHVAGQLPVDDVDADVDDDRARLEHLARDEPRAPDGDDDHVGGAGDRREVARVRVADRDRRVLAQEEQRGGLADDVGPADDDRVPALELDAALREDLDRGVGGRRQEAVVAERQEAGVDRVDAVDVAQRVEVVDDRPERDPGREGHLGDDPGHARVRGELADRRAELRRAAFGRQLDQAVLDAHEPAAVEDLVEVDGGRRVPADDDDRQRGREPALGLERGDVLGDLLPDRRGDRAAAQEPRALVGEDRHAGPASGARVSPPWTWARAVVGQPVDLVDQRVGRRLELARPAPRRRSTGG